MSRADLIDMKAEGILQSEIARLDALHDANSAGLLKQDLENFKKGISGIEGEVLHSEMPIGSMEKDFQDSVVFKKGRAAMNLKELINKNDAQDRKRRRELLFAKSTLYSFSLQIQSCSIKDEIDTAVKSPSSVTYAPDDPIPSRATAFYEAIYSVLIAKVATRS